VTITVLKPGALSQLQDLGRYGYQRYGVVVGGAMDEWAYRVANALVGNDENEASLEMTLTGPTLRFDAPARIAVCGADLSARVDGTGGTHLLPYGRPVDVAAGSQLRFGARVAGARAYLAVAGGFDAPLVMGSRSTYVRGGFGGLEGRALRKGDVLAVRVSSVPATPGDTSWDTAGDESRNTSRNRAEAAENAASTLAALTLSVPASPVIVPVPRAAAVQTIRITAGRHWEVFTAEARRLLLATEFRIGAQSDRMGYRLEGPELARARPIEMISESVTFGTIQVPPDGKPIILMADRQTTGGYPKIASVASADLSILAQMTAPEALRFTLITLAEAQRIQAAREDEYSRLRQAMEEQT
jgi:urea carboxylase